MKSLVDHAYRAPFKKRISEQCRRDIVRLMDRLDQQAPRVIEKSSATVWYLFTDASFEPGDGDNAVAGLGAVLYDDAGNAVSQFSQMLSRAQYGRFRQWTERLLSLNSKCWLLFWHLFSGGRSSPRHKWCVI